MKFLIALVFAVVGFFLVSRIFGRSDKIEQEKVTTRHFKRLVSQLKQSGSDGAFWVVLVPGTRGRDRSNANLQMSIEKGKPGLDWVLNCERNKADSDKVTAWFNERKIVFKSQSMNDMEYLRVEHWEDWPGLARDLLASVYSVDDDTEMELIVEGFDWP